ncbi:hypothetical protein HHI36_002677 [Cryptolaemus montrouzieri]|uniref:Uncharacterized protein n=1 Tax=Cryptolaemus montrouzieri TaxID=559131 RepID=A0ABD2PB63_9CUCU
MSKLDETILPKLMRMEEKYNSLMEEFVLQANENRTIKSELVLVKKELFEIKNRNGVNPKNILKEVHERSVISNDVIILDLVESNTEDIRKRIKQDVDLVKELLAAADSAPEQVSEVLRLGKKGRYRKIDQLK